MLDRMMVQVKEAEEKAIAGADATQIAIGGKLSLLLQQAKEDLGRPQRQVMVQDRFTEEQDVTTNSFPTKT